MYSGTVSEYKLTKKVSEQIYGLVLTDGFEIKQKIKSLLAWPGGINIMMI